MFYSLLMKKTTDISRYQLPKTVVPGHYDVTIRADFTTFRFHGRVAAEVEVMEPVSRITMHSLGLKITAARVTDSAGISQEAARAKASVALADPAGGKPVTESFTGAAALDAKEQTAVLSFPRKVGAGKAHIELEYEGSMVQPSLEGFYRSKWTDEGGKDHWVASTQFEATHARRAFPCWDEPALKVSFALTLSFDAGMTALANMRAVSERVEGGVKTVTFAATPKMSTYLVAWCIGELESSPAADANGKELRIWSVPGKNAYKAYALKCAKFGVEWYERTLGVPYFAGDKIDMVAIPDFRSGAMENTGLITYRATALLVDQDHATVGELQRVAEVVFHELAHMWFGNLVTMAWWDGLPLNESNATIFAYFVMDDFMPEWKIFNAFGIDRAMAFGLDSLNSTHPCWAPVGHPDEVEQRFDRITYEKGGSLELQLMKFVGDRPFYSGAAHYLRKYSLGNAEVTDLWDAMEEGVKEAGVDVPVRRVMDAWFLTDGHPVVTVSPSKKPGFITLMQTRFAFIQKASHALQLWPIPAHLRYVMEDGSAREEKVLFEGREREVFAPEGLRSVVVNAGGTGFYRVRYTRELLDRLLEKPMDTLQVIERFNLANDAWAFVRAQIMGTDEYLDIIRKLAAERDPNVWSVIGGSLRVLHAYTAEGTRAAFQELVRALVSPVFRELGWKPSAGESSAVLELRGALAGLLGTVAEDPAVQAECTGLFESWKKDRGAVDPNVVPAIVATLAHTGGKARYDEFLELSRKAPTDQEKLRFLRALGGFRDPALYTAAVSMMLTEVKTDDAPYILGAFLQTEHAGKTTWEAIRDGWQKILSHFPASGTVRMIDGCSALDTPELAADVRKFFSRTKVPQGDMAVAQMLERLGVNERLRQAETPRLKKYLGA